MEMKEVVFSTTLHHTQLQITSGFSYNSLHGTKHKAAEMVVSQRLQTKNEHPEKALQFPVPVISLLLLRRWSANTSLTQAASSGSKTFLQRTA